MSHKYDLDKYQKKHVQKKEEIGRVYMPNDSHAIAGRLP